MNIYNSTHLCRRVTAARRVFLLVEPRNTAAAIAIAYIVAIKEKSVTVISIYEFIYTHSTHFRSEIPFSKSKGHSTYRLGSFRRTPQRSNNCRTATRRSAPRRGRRNEHGPARESGGDKAATSELHRHRCGGSTLRVRGNNCIMSLEP